MGKGQVAGTVSCRSYLKSAIDFESFGQFVVRTSIFFLHLLCFITLLIFIISYQVIGIDLLHHGLL